MFQSFFFIFLLLLKKLQIRRSFLFSSCKPLKVHAQLNLLTFMFIGDATEARLNRIMCCMTSSPVSHNWGLERQPKPLIQFTPTHIRLQTMMLGTMFIPYRTIFCQTLPKDWVASSIHWHSNFILLPTFYVILSSFWNNCEVTMLEANSNPFICHMIISYGGLVRLLLRTSLYLWTQGIHVHQWAGHEHTIFSPCHKIPHSTHLNHLTITYFLLSNCYLTRDAQKWWEHCLWCLDPYSPPYLPLDLPRYAELDYNQMDLQSSAH